LLCHQEWFEAIVSVVKSMLLVEVLVMERYLRHIQSIENLTSCGM